MSDDHGLPASAFADFASGLDYLAGVPLGNPELAETQLLFMLDTLIASPPEGELLFALLEQLRAPLCFVEETLSRRYHNKPLPLGQDEADRWRQVVAAWRKMSQAYQLCLGSIAIDSLAAGEPIGDDVEAPRLTLATALHRALYYTGRVMLEHYRVHRELPEGIWLELHNLYRMAEVRGIALEPVEDNLENDQRKTSCAAGYCAVLLIELANPYGHTLHDLNLIQRWAFLWGPLLGILPAAGQASPAYLIEPKQDRPLHQPAPGKAPGGESRQLDTHRLAQEIQHALHQLGLRVTPSQLSLGEETISHVSRLLGGLAGPWTLNASPRRFRRFDTVGGAKVVTGFGNIFSFINGSEVRQSDTYRPSSRKDLNQLLTFRERLEPGEMPTVKAQSAFPIDVWDVLNHSANGFRIRRGNAGERLTFGQLMAIRPHDGERYLLGQSTWLMEERDGGLVAGVETLPGLPQGVGVRLSQDDGPNPEGYEVAFLLPAVPAIRAEASLVLPAGMYKASHILDVDCEGKSWRLRMVHVMQRGSDFDRISYQKL